VAQAVQHQPIKHKDMKSNPSITKNCAKNKEYNFILNLVIENKILVFVSIDG
jgi:hypothetical protein